MKKIFLPLFLLISLPSFSQMNIYTILHLNEKDYDYKTKIPKEVYETRKSYNSDKTYTSKTTKYYDASGMLEREDRFNSDGDLESFLTYVNDTVNRIKLSRTYVHLGKYTKKQETAEYIYNNGQLVKVLDKDKNQNIYFTTEIRNDSKGNPIVIYGYSSNGSLYGRETAEYNYENNTVITSVFSNDSKLLSTKVNWITFENTKKDCFYNENKDLIKWKYINLNNKETLYEAEYEYDKSGNIIEEKIYKVTLKPDGKREKKIDKNNKRKYKY
ncbi:hypothetical protein [Dysgonomonas sp.]